MHYISFFSQKSTILLLFFLLGQHRSVYSQTDALVNLSDDFLLSLSKDSLLSYEKEARLTNFNLTIRIQDAIIKKAKNNQNYKDLSDAYIIRAKHFLFNNQFRTALIYFDSAAVTVKPVDVRSYTGIQIDKAIVLQGLRKYSDARSIYLNILKDSNISKDTLHRHVSLCNLGVLFEEVGDYNNAIRYYNEAIQAVTYERNKSYICTYLANLSEAYKSNSELNQAYDYIQKSYSIAMSEPDLELKNRVLVNYAHILGSLNRFEDAFAKIEEGFQYCRGEYSKRYINNLSIAKAEILLIQHNPSASKGVFLECYNRLQNIPNKAKITYHLGAIHFDENNTSRAKVFLSECQQLSEQNNILDYGEKAHRLLFKIFDSENNATKALFHLKAANSIRDTMLNLEKSEQISALQFKFDLEQSEHKFKTIELNANRNMMLLGILTTLCVIGALLYIMRMRSKNYHDLKAKNTLIEAQKQELEAQNDILELQKRKLEESNNLLKQFSYAVAHDLKEPMRTVSNFSSIIVRKYKAQLPDDAGDYFDYIISGAKRMTNMLDGLMQYAIVSTKNENTEVFELSDVVTEVTQSLYKKIEDSQATITFGDSMPRLNMSRIHATQLVQNLVSNGLKFVEKNPYIEIKSQIIDNKAILSIKDNGIGIDKISGSKLFNLFHRIHRDNSRFEGTGIGLALCKNIAEKYHGKIWFESEPNEGTTFFVQLPLAV